jgi:hypothetical protein
MQWTLADLILLRGLRIAIDPEMFAKVLRTENIHRNFAPCSGCGVPTFCLHQFWCPYASVLWLPDWFEVVQT